MLPLENNQAIPQSSVFMTSSNSLTPITQRKLSLTKRIVLRTLTAGLVLVVLELIGLAALCLVRAGFSMQGLKLEQQSIAEGIDVPDGATEAFHPYLG